MYSYKLNNSYTVYVNYAYINECIKASRCNQSSNVKTKKKSRCCSTSVDAKNIAKIGSKVSVMDMDTQEQDVYTITYSENINIAKGFISDVSPIGRSLLGHSVGDMITVNAPAGVIRYKIIDLRS